MSLKIKERRSYVLELQPCEFDNVCNFSPVKHSNLSRENGGKVRNRREALIVKGGKRTEKGVCDYSVIWVRSIRSCLMIICSIW